MSRASHRKSKNIRIVMLTRSNPWQIQAVNHLHATFGLQAVYFEGGRFPPPCPGTLNWQFVRKRLSSKQVYRFLRHPRRSISMVRQTLWQMRRGDPVPAEEMNDEVQSVYRSLFRHPWDCLSDRGLPSFHVGFRQFPPEHIAQFEPEIIIVFGTSIIPPKVSALASSACLNLHWGLSPYYRGSYCTEWAIYNNDLQNIGVTIHLIDPGIDTGPIIVQRRPTIEPTDTPFSINMKLSVLGIELIIEVINWIREGKRFYVHPQDRSQGKLYLIKHWTPEIERVVQSKLDDGAVSSLLTTTIHESTRDLYPIIELTEAPADGVGCYEIFGQET